MENYPGSSAGNWLKFEMFMILCSDSGSSEVRVSHLHVFELWRWKVYLNTLREYFYMYYRVFSLFCRSVWPQSEDGKLFISWGSLNTALGARECKRGFSCIIQLLYIQAFRYIHAVMQCTCTRAHNCGGRAQNQH